MNKENNKGFFKSFIPLSSENDKIKIFEKQVGGKTVKYLRGVATNTLVDKEDERMSKNFVSKIKSTAMGLNVFSEHEHSIDKTVGFIDDVGGDENNVVIDTALEDENDNAIVKSVLKKIEHGTKIGYSIGGKILKAKKVFDESLQKWVNEIDDGEIYEVSLTAMPAGEGTWVEPIMKSLKEFVQENGEDEIDEEFDKALTHNSKTLDNEPAWSTVNKTSLPRQAFADKGDPKLKSTWKYPHHWVTGGNMYLHKGGLNAAWAAANGARSGVQASSAVKEHLQKHRKALGMKKGNNFENIDEIKKHLNKALDEMMQENQIKDDLWDLFYAFRQSMYQIVESDKLTPAQKKQNIINISQEFGTKVEELSGKIIELTTAVEEQLGLNAA